MDLSASTAREGVRLCAAIQSSALEADKDGQASLLRRQDAMQDAPRNPLGAYQKGALESRESAQKTFRLFEATAQVVSRSAERLQASAERAGQEIPATFTELAGRVKSLYTPLA